VVFKAISFPQSVLSKTEEVGILVEFKILNLML